MASVTLANCDQEPIHVPAAIQPHGAALVCAEGTLMVEQASENLESYLGVSAVVAVGQPLGPLFEDVSASLLAAIAAEPAPRSRGATLVRAQNGRIFDAVVHRTGDAIVVELEPHTLDLVGFHPVLREAIARFQTTTGILDLCTLSAVEVRRLIGFDRVMVYRFDGEWNGEVIAEAKRDDLESFLGHHYPASDIPAQARRLYTINWLRLIPDAAYRPCALVPPLRPSGASLDMSHSVLRSVSPIHCEYLANMGVRASMSISLLRDGQLWGMIACHHYSGPRTVPFALRDSAEFLGQTLSWIVSAREAAITAERERDSQRVESELLRAMTSTRDFVDGLAIPPLLRVANADGAAVIFEDQVRLVGAAPSENVVRELAEWLRNQAFTDDIFVTDNLHALRPEVDATTIDLASGVLAVAISRNHREFVVWFRVSTEHVVPWAGHPTKEVDPNAPRLSPRGSFALWYETVRGRSLPWHRWEVIAAGNLRRVILGGVRRRAVELRQLADKLAEADQMKDSFLAAVSHELRTPLNAIVGWSRILRAREVPEAFAHGLRVIERNAHAQTQLVDDLLDISRMTTGKLVLNPQPIDLGTIVKSSLESVSLSAEAKEIRLHSTIDRHAAVVVGDGQRLQQVFWNLVSNAIKFTPKGGQVDIILRQVRADVEIAISDTGRGIDPSFLPHVFESFRQADRGDQRGLGLGLAISRHIVELHGGTITAESGGEGKGTTMRVCLPPAALEARPSELPSTSPSLLTDQRLSGYRVMVVEDDPDSRELLGAVLTQAGAIVAAYATAGAALEALSGEHPDVIISDVGLPDMDGHAFLRHLRTLPPEQGAYIPAVAMTAYARPRDRTLALTAGFQSYVSKPIDSDELVAVLQALLGRTTPVRQ